MRIERDRAKCTLYIDQEAYIEKILNKYENMSRNRDRTSKPGTSHHAMQVSKDLLFLDESEQNEYQQLVGRLLYAALSTRPDIAHSVAMASKYNKKLIGSMRMQY